MESKDTFRDLQFDGKPSGYRDFRRKTILAVAGLENRHAHLAGPRLLQRLQGEAWRATEHLKIADLRKQNGWLEVIHALDLHYRFLPETELHEAVEEFLFSMKRRPGEGATSFSSRFRTQLDRVQTLIAQEREMHRTRKKPKRGRKKRDATDADMPEQPSSSLEESDKSEDPKDPEHAEPATEEEAAPAGATASAAAAGQTTDEGEHSAQTGRSKPPSSAGSKRERASLASKGSRASQLSRGTHKAADQERDSRRMMEMLGSLEHGHLRPKPIFPQAILGHLFMRKFGLNREQRAHIIRSTNGSSRLEDVERIVRASDLEEFRSDDRRREERKPIKHARRDAYAVQDEQQVLVADDHDSSSDIMNPEDDLESESDDALAVEQDAGDSTNEELQEI